MSLPVWAAEHSVALGEHVAAGTLSFAEMASAINEKFNTHYSRNACIGRARRLEYSAPGKPKPVSKTRMPRVRSAPKDPQRAEKIRTAAPKAESTSQLRCVEIIPRHLSLIDLEPGDCRYPYGGDREGEAITFCGHPVMPDRSWCVPHSHLCRGPGTTSERRAVRGVAA